MPPAHQDACQTKEKHWADRSDGSNRQSPFQWFGPATDVAMKVATDALQLFGSAGVSKDNRIEQYFRDAKVLQIIEGTNQIQRNIIGKHIIKEIS